VDGVVSEHTIDAGESILELPSGNSVTFFVRPGFTSLWLQPVAFGVIRNAKWQFYGSVLGKQTLMLEDGDELIVNFDHPSPPWNAVCIPVRNQWVLVTLERPWAMLDVDKWIRKEWQGQEELPNTALFWAREGIDGLAKELAASFVERRNDPALRGRVRGKMHTSLTVGAAENAVFKPFQEITVDELARELKTAFTLLREQRPPYGPSIAEEIARAKAILQSRGVKVSE